MTFHCGRDTRYSSSIIYIHISSNLFRQYEQLTNDCLNRSSRYDTIRYDTIRYDTIRYVTIRYERYDCYCILFLQLVFLSYSFRKNSLLAMARDGSLQEISHTKIIVFCVFLFVLSFCRFACFSAVLHPASAKPERGHGDRVPGSECRGHSLVFLPRQVGSYYSINTIQYNAIQCNTIQYNTIQYNTIQYNTIQYNTNPA